MKLKYFCFELLILCFHECYASVSEVRLLSFLEFESLFLEKKKSLKVESDCNIHVKTVVNLVVMRFFFLEKLYFVFKRRYYKHSIKNLFWKFNISNLFDFSYVFRSFVFSSKIQIKIVSIASWIMHQHLRLKSLSNISSTAFIENDLWLFSS